MDLLFTPLMYMNGDSVKPVNTCDCEPDRSTAGDANRPHIVLGTMSEATGQ